MKKLKERNIYAKEIIVPSDQIIVSHTDLKGLITYVNDTFVEISGYSRDSLIGNPHNSVRHPDMPEAAFADLWRTIKTQRPWRGVVKNLARDGRYYWVDARVSSYFEDSEHVGYISVRFKPSPESIKLAEDLYAALRSGQKKLPKRAKFSLKFSHILTISAFTSAIWGYFLGLTWRDGIAIAWGFPLLMLLPLGMAIFYRKRIGTEIKKATDENIHVAKGFLMKFSQNSGRSITLSIYALK